MTFVYTRIDDRAIHGQTVTMWSKVYNNNGIILVDDIIANDKVMKEIYKNAGLGIKVYVYNIENALLKAKEAANSQKPYILIARNPITVLELFKNGINIGNSITVGNMPLNDNRKVVSGFVAMNEEEISACNELENNNIKVIIQNIPSSPITEWQSLNLK